MERLATLAVRLRFVTLVATLIVTAGAVYLASTLKIYDDPNRWPPEDDPHVLLNDHLQTVFGGANLVTVMISRNDGETIVQADTLAMVKRITDALREIHGVIPYALRSLSEINSRHLKGTATELSSTILFADAGRAPETPEELARVAEGIQSNAALKHGLVSKDGSSVIIQADFRTGLGRAVVSLPVTDPISIYKDVQAIIVPENDEVHTVTAAGSPILIGWVNSDGLPYIWTAFFIVIAGIFIVLVFAFRSVVGVVPPLLVGVMASIWAFGMQRLIEGDVLSSSAALLAPFIILAVAASHSVLFIKRLLTDEMGDDRTKLEGLRQTLIHMMRPLVVVLVTDLMAFIVLSFVPFDNVRLLGQVTALGIASIVLIVPTFLVALLSLMPDASIGKAVTWAEQGRRTGKGWIYRSTAVIVRPLIYNRSTQWAVLVISGILVAVSLSLWFSIPFGGNTALGRFLAAEIETGQNNTYAVHNYLTKSWEDNALYQMEQEITERFGGVYTMTMLARGRKPDNIKTPEALQDWDKLELHMAEAEGVTAVVGLPFYIKILNKFLNEDKDEFFAIPTNDTVELEGRAQVAVNEALYFLTSGTPGAFDFIVDPFFENTVSTVFVRDTDPETVANLIARAKKYVAEEWDAEGHQVDVYLPAGNVGIAEAFNRQIKKWMVWATVLSAIASYLAAGLMLRSATGPLLLMFPLAAGIVIWMFLIHLIGIEFNSNVTAALAIASGVGIDAEVYLLYRFREEYPKDRDFHRALFHAFTLVREPLIFSFGALFAGCLAVSVVPLYVGYVGFSMALILLATFLLSFFAAPVIWSMVRPRFLTRGLDGGDRETPSEERLETAVQN